ncbi:hypothetical protein [Streptomyces sp. NBC_01497]|uniref:hypothetical protein n=1 Tax=Streptomyces sp. NBC_01497 TaxID=2903885 RepID=UPI003FCDF588
MLAHLRNWAAYTQLADGLEIGTSTLYRHVSEAVDVPAAEAIADAATALTTQHRVGQAVIT